MPDDPKPGKLALSILSAGTVAEMRDQADELSMHVRAILAPLPVLPTDPATREKVLMVWLLAKDEAARRLLAAVA